MTVYTRQAKSAESPRQGRKAAKKFEVISKGEAFSSYGDFRGFLYEALEIYVLGFRFLEEARFGLILTNRRHFVGG